MFDSLFKKTGGLGLLLGVLVLMAYAFGDRDSQRLATILQTTFEESQTVVQLPSATPSASSVLGTVATATDSADFYPVTHITDGDTIKVEINGRVETIRIVGINTPETVDPRQDIQCFGQQASDQLKALLSNKVVRLETDPTQNDRDRYQRLLRFVFLADGTDVGLLLIQEGFAQESLYSSKPHKYRDLYLAAQTTAQQQQKGLWNPTTCPPR